MASYKQITFNTVIKSNLNKVIEEINNASFEFSTLKLNDELSEEEVTQIANDFFNLQISHLLTQKLNHVFI